MLNGIGGRTIEEARERMSHAEAVDWMAYMKKRGSLNTGARIELGFALLAALVVKAMGGRAQMQDFMTSPEEDEEATIEDVMAILIGAKR